jgi:hypothetical protein
MFTGKRAEEFAKENYSAWPKILLHKSKLWWFAKSKSF